MQITSKFTIAVHIITAIDYFKDDMKVTSNFLAGSVGANPVIVRTVMGSLKDAGIISISQGKSGIALAKGLDEITFYDIYKAIDPVGEEGLFHFHENPNIECPVGRNIHAALDARLHQIQDKMETEMKSIVTGTVISFASSARKNTLPLSIHTK